MKKLLIVPRFLIGAALLLALTSFWLADIAFNAFKMKPNLMIMLISYKEMFSLLCYWVRTGGFE